MHEISFRWQKDPMCTGSYPKTYDELKKTISNHRTNRFGKAPINGTEILEKFEKEQILKDYGFSLLQERGRLFNDVIITDQYENVIFSSAKCIALIVENVPQNKRFFIVDGTFRITPKGVWQQTLILHAYFGEKVRQKIICKNFSLTNDRNRQINYMFTAGINVRRSWRLDCDYFCV